MTCRKLRDIYQDNTLYNAYERQNHQIVYNLTHNFLHLPTLREALNIFLMKRLTKIIIPVPDTLEWQQLLHQPFTHALPWQACLSKIYISAWELLLQPETTNNLPQALELMRLLIDLSAYVDASSYITKLAHTSSWAIFSQLANTSLECCLQLIAKHLPMNKGSLAYEFFLRQCPPLGNVKTYQEKIEYLKQQGKVFTHQPPLIIDYHLQELQQQPLLSVLVQQLLSNERERQTYEALLFILLERGCDFQSYYGKQVLLFILQEGLFSFSDSQRTYTYLCKIFKLLLEQGADYNVTNSKGNTPLLLLCQGDRYRQDYDKKPLSELTLFLLQQPTLNVNASNDQGDNALMCLIQKNNGSLLNLSVIKALLHHPQLDHESVRQQKACALYLAIEDNDLETAKILCTPASLCFATRVYAFIYTLWCKKEEIATLFLQAVDWQEKQAFVDRALAMTIEHTPEDDFCELVPLLLYHGADCNTPAGYGEETALMAAFRYGQKVLVKGLLQRPQLNVNAVNIDDRTALHYAIDKGDFSLVQMLLESNKVRYSTRLQAFNYALEKAEDRIAGILLVTAEGEQSQFVDYALMGAQDKQQGEVVEILKIWRKRYITLQ
jgi:ankyrin repeat protein